MFLNISMSKLDEKLNDENIDHTQIK